jgi:excinuclease ABC subunit C
VASALDGIVGIGPKRKQDLLKAFKSVARIRQAKEEEIARVVGQKAAQSILQALNKDINKE